MKALLIFFIFLASVFMFRADQTIAAVSSLSQADTSKTVLFFEDFNNNDRKWTVGKNKQEEAYFDSGYYVMTARGHAYGEAQEVKINTRKDFEIESRIKIADGEADHKNYYSMLFWGREGNSTFSFGFAMDGFAFVERCEGINQSSCAIEKGSLQKTELRADDFNVYTIRKKGRTYTFLVNGEQFFQMPFVPFYGNLLGFGAGRKSTLVVDYLKVQYL